MERLLQALVAKEARVLMQRRGFLSKRVQYILLVLSLVVLAYSNHLMTYKRRKYHRGDTQNIRKYRLKRKAKDLDEIDADLNNKQEELLAQAVDVEKAGCAQFYCIHCARYFVDEQAITEHYRSKLHKRRLKDLELEPYSIAESERASGQSSYVPPKKRKIETLLPKALLNSKSESGERVGAGDEEDVPK